MKLDTTINKPCNCGEHEMKAWCEYCKFWMCVEVSEAHIGATGHKCLVIET